ncbi:hypothetical protein ES707_12907 [subsurface metagenome]
MVRQTSALGRGIFLVLSGSIAGGMIAMRGPLRSEGTNFSMVKIAASCSSTWGRRNCHVSLSGSELSIWQRQIHLAFMPSQK